jgi:hypothetical protein
MTHAEVREYARLASMQLDGLHGDPSKAANWCRERDLARIVLHLLDVIGAANGPVEIWK